jgi:phosphoribosylamine--glycine ligase
VKALVVGGGGREHALAWKLAASRSVEKVYVAPGNAGTAREQNVENIPIASTDIDSLGRFAEDQDVGLTVVGPETPLVNGIIDHFHHRNRPCLGPSRNAAKLEGSKTFAKRFMERHQIPTARYQSFDNAEKAVIHARKIGPPLVVKADGLAAGKGVVIAHTLGQAELAIRQLLDERRFGAAGDQVILEDYLTGEEASFICLVSNDQVLPLATSQDHKARDAGDAGPNTGGMGAYSPAPVITRPLYQRIMRQVIEPTVRGLSRDGISYTGFLYAGLMIDLQGSPRVLEFNCRLGDPETQPILLRLRSDLAELCGAALAGELHRIEIQWDSRAALGVVMAAGGYPAEYAIGDIITGLADSDDSLVKIFHGGTAIEGGRIVTNGGRVLCVTALGDNVTVAQSTAYQAVHNVHWSQAYFRPDIGYRAVSREHAVEFDSR